MKNLKIGLLIYYSLSFAYATELRSIKWEKISSKNAIDVFAPKEFEHESGLIPIRFKAIINHDILKVLSVLADNKRKTEWLPRLVAAKVIDRKSIYELTVYYRYDFPWPFSDRDFVIHTKGEYNPDTDVISVDLESTQHEKAPLRKGIIRGTSIDGYTIIQAAGDNATEVEMAILNDFGGWMPNFIINSAQKDWPNNFMTHLREQLVKADIKINPAFKK